ncbi:MAG TPA: universal stress protein [Anaerolineae bacterium]|nr:universal stress protein [Anaerolineae bacterium]
MGLIVCATRSGEASRMAQDKAISLAQERGYDLVFLYVLDPNVLARTSYTRPRQISHDLCRMGEFILTIAQEHAARKGIRASWEIRVGEVQREIKRFVQEKKASYLIMGCPSEDIWQRIFSPSDLHAFAAEVERETGVPVILVSPEEGEGGGEA